MLCFVVVMQSFIMNSHEAFIHINQGCFAGTGAIVRLPQCQWSKPDGYGEISQYITTTKHSKAKTVCIFLGIYCRWVTQSHKCANTRGQFHKYQNTPVPYTTMLHSSQKCAQLCYELSIVRYGWRARCIVWWCHHVGIDNEGAKTTFSGVLCIYHIYL